MPLQKEHIKKSDQLIHKHILALSLLPCLASSLSCVKYSNKIFIHLSIHLFPLKVFFLIVETIFMPYTFIACCFLIFYSLNPSLCLFFFAYPYCIVLYGCISLTYTNCCLVSMYFARAIIK